MIKRTVEAKMNYFIGGMPLRLPVRNDLHLIRKAWHLGMGLVIVFIYMAGLSRTNALTILSFFLGLALLMETLRLKNSALNEKFVRYWSPFMRKHEVNQMSTLPHYVSSVILAIAIFPKPIAILSILYLACGDPIASLVGILYGRKGPRICGNKTVIGTAAGFAVCVIVSLIYLKALGLPESAVWPLSLVGGLAGGLAELLPFDVDDNFTIPMISGFVLWLAFMIIGL
jgi:dolichol kinase